jgi:DNA-binding transcriptional ArsR family regulator
MMGGPDISLIASLIGNPACANMLLSLMPGPALTSSELAEAAGLTAATTSGHLAKLEKYRLVVVERQGRHRYYRLADAEVAHAIESLLPLAERAGHLRTRPGPRDPELRFARSCYDHLAGDLAVRMYDQFVARKLIARSGDEVSLTDAGRRFFACQGIDIAELERSRRLLCRPCLDWSERRCHLSGTLGAAILSLFLARGWIVRERGQRVVRFARDGQRKIEAWISAADSTPDGPTRDQRSLVGSGEGRMA